MSYFPFLWYVVFSLPSGAHTIALPSVLQVMTEVTEASFQEAPISYADTSDEFERRLRTASIALTFGWCEGGWKADPGGDACGVGQMYPVVGEPSCRQLRTDRKLAWRAMIARMRKDVADCGSVKSGLGRYATGKCGWAKDLIDKRCAWSLVGCGPTP